MTEDRNDSLETSDNDRNIAFVKALAEILQENDLEELEVERHHKGAERLTVRISRHASPASTASPTFSPPAAPVATAPAETPAEPVQAAVVSDDPAELPGAVTSPMVGTAYLSPEPGASPFVSVGDSVTEGQTLLIIEAMKTMNQIQASAAGVVKRILVEDASPVEYGAPLMIVEQTK